MPIMRFSLAISSERYLAWYAGAASAVQVRADDGRTLRFPAAELRLSGVSMRCTMAIGRAPKAMERGADFG